MKAIGIGNALVDVLLQLENDEILSSFGLQKGTMDLIDENQMVSIRKAQENLKRSQAPGGSVCNTMRAMAQLGASVGFIGKIGSDEAGAYYEEALRKANVISYFSHVPGISGSSTVMISPDAERTMATFLGPAATLTAEEISDEVLSAYDCIYIEGYLIANERLFVPVLKQAKRLGLKVALDLSNFNVVNGFKELLLEVIPSYVDILFSNESEAEAFAGRQAEKAVSFISRMADISVVTMGSKGALVGCKDGIIRIPVSGGAPVDTTGAGDHFAAGFLYGLSAGRSLEKSARVGSFLAGCVVDIIGAQIPDRQWEQIKLKVREILS